MYFNVPTGISSETGFNVALSSVAEETNHRVAEAEQEARRIGELLSVNALSFSNLVKTTKYPTFIYSGGALVFWSDHTIIPDLDFPPKVTVPTAVTNVYGKFVVVPHQQFQYNIYVYIPLQVDYRISNSFLSSGLQKDIFGDMEAEIVLDASPELPNIATKDGVYLFSLDIKNTKQASGLDMLVLLLLVTGVIFFVLFSVSIASRKFQEKKYSQGIILLLLLLAGLRFLLLKLNLPFAIVEMDLFDPKLYASSTWSPSVGDLALNVLLLALIAWASHFLFRKNKVLSQLKEMEKKQSRVLQIACLASFFLLLLVLFKFYYGIYSNSPLVLDINQSLSVTKYKLLIYGIMFVYTASLCVFVYILATIVSVQFQKEPKSWAYKVLAVLGLLILGLAAFFASHLAYIFLAGLLFWLVVAISAHHRYAVNFPYRTYLFFFLVVAISAFTGAMALYTQYQNELKDYKQNFALNILQEHDVLGEYLLEEVSAGIASDQMIQMKMMGPYVDAAFIKRKIARQYLRDYFDKYEIDVLLFDGRGNTLESADPAAPTLQGLLLKYVNPQTLTEYPNLYLVEDPTKYDARMYLKLIEVPMGPWQKGFIVLQLTLKKLLPHSVVPELLVDQKYDQPFRAGTLSYAIYNNGELSYSEGEYDYATNFRRGLMQRSELYAGGTTQGAYHHFGDRQEEGKTLIITTEKYGGREVLSNFSLLFLLYVVGVIFCGFLFLFLQRQRLREFRPTFGTKIQIFLNLGILLPLLLVSITIASLVTASYKKDLTLEYEHRGEAIQENLRTHLTQGLLQSRRDLQAKVSEVASISESDINLYDRNGRLLVTSQPLIFEAGLLSQLINPEAFAAISERNALRVLLDEKAGSLTFNALYLPVRRNGSQSDLIAYIGIPFFDSERQLDIRLIELVTTTMNIFTIMFIVFIVLTFFASRILTVPLRLLADKLKRTSLTGKNEMLAYEGADEIGMLVNEYNRMLLTLEQNKVDLAMQEKEAAWKEMARQVAHEIKNPLTPMKLSLQYLQKAIDEKKPNTEQLIHKISHTLITQINILSDIATSFSNFTSMPEPKNERMNVAAALRESANLHNDPATVILACEIPDREVAVIADQSLMVRTFNNLLLNAIQAVPADKKPQIRIKLEKQEQTVFILISDNGSGIPEDIRNKVFIPNFSTKYTGSGIGLAVAKKGIENAGGRIWFETEEGQGTTFFISLPLAEP
ncbi:sensor histidine kinase [Pontibacter harenae]|uniref:sensor histidine kinase n=1 Tax=Pontibacter harenae TaxID=2894083 RepID=UPI001E5AC1AB|nr:HAMP domain-containing sensor histidine kinase [Pontibacter harenae]